MNEQKIISERITALCKEKKMSYYELAIYTRVPMTTLMHVVDGSTKNPGVITILKICRGLGVTLSEFFTDEMFYEMEKGMEEL